MGVSVIKREINTFQTRAELITPHPNNNKLTNNKMMRTRVEEPDPVFQSSRGREEKRRRRAERRRAHRNKQIQKSHRGLSSAVSLSTNALVLVQTTPKQESTIGEFFTRKTI